MDARCENSLSSPDDWSISFAKPNKPIKPIKPMNACRGRYRTNTIWLRPQAATVLVLAALLILSSCGFQLRGRQPLAPALARIYVDDQQQSQPSSATTPSPPGPLTTALKQALRANGAEVLNTPSDDASRLTLIRVSDQRRTLATGRAGAVREYHLRYQVEFSLISADAQALYGPDQISVSRDILYDETDILGAVAGEQLSRRQLIDDAVAAILRRLRSVTAAGS